MTRVIDQGTSQAKSMYIGSAIDDASLDPYEFRIYCHLKRRAQDGVVWERQDKMAGICLMSRKTVNEVLSRLEEKKWIEQKQRTLKGQQSSNLIYLLEPPCNPQLHSRVTDGYTAVSPTVTAEGTPLEGTPLEGKDRGKKVSPEKTETLTLPDWLSQESWTDFLAYRKALKAPVTELSGKRLLKTLTDLRGQGHDPVKVIDQTIATGKWTGLFPLKVNTAASYQQTGTVRGQEAAVSIARITVEEPDF